MGSVPEPTIYDVATRAGVAASTVSRAFGVPGRVSERTRQKVVAAAEELGYVPNPHARALQSGKHATIALMLADITNPYFFELIRGAEQRARVAGNTLVIVNAEESRRIEFEQIQGLTGAVDGFILAASRLSDDELRALAGKHRLVLLDRELPPIPSVVRDMRGGCRQILEHLSSLGHREVAYCSGPPTSWMSAERWAALSGGAEEHGLTLRRVGPYAPTVANGAVAADGALRAGVTAVVAHNDLLAIGIVRRLRDRGVAVPEDVSVVGFDDIFAAELLEPPLTTLGAPGAQAGRLAVELLLDPPGRHHPAQLRLPSDLVIRRSSGPGSGG
ncbi:LacI family DNA-binding transcriptional regulator [Nocardioides insulae]|uniref:LacI family DNA-binding transcriptional regulator n=1 Tax=Nocardioides insulae TaxID=394734 RepID=UPI000414BF5A|nr:LacI family DNA-binding transcriptional regulator [Nocardioides insulae]